MKSRRIAMLLSICLVVGVILGSVTTTFAAAHANLDPNDIAITNSQEGTDDLITVSNLTVGDTVRVYASNKAGSPAIATKIATAATLKIYIEQIGRTAGTLYFTVESSATTESAKVSKTFTGENVTTALDASQIGVTNNPLGKPDRVNVTGLNPGDVVRVYLNKTGGKAVGTDTVDAGQTTANVYATQLGAKGGTVYVTLKVSGRLESARTAKTFVTEITAPISATKTIIVNNSGTGSDSITVDGLAETTQIRFYASAKATTYDESIAVDTGDTSVTLTTTKLLDAGGTAYITAIFPGKSESPKVAVKYVGSAVSSAPLLAYITVANNKLGINDTITVDGLQVGDTISAYAKPLAFVGETALATSAAVGSGASTASISLAQLGAKAGTVYISVTSTGKDPSKRVAAKYTSETTPAPVASKITVTNNKGGNDTIKIDGLVKSDVVNLYKAAIGSETWDSALTVGNGATSVTFSIPQLGTIAGKVFVTVTKDNKFESPRVAKAYAAELKDATLKTTSTVKGEQVTLGTYATTIAAITPGSVDITGTEAANTTNLTSFITLFDKTDSTAVVKVVKYASGATPTEATFNTAAAYANQAITDNDFFIVRVVAGDKKTTNYYRIDVNVQSSDATVTSGTYTVSAVVGGQGTITLAAADITKATFLANITLGDSNAVIDSSAIGDPVANDETLVVTAEDGTVVTYTIVAPTT